MPGPHGLGFFNDRGIRSRDDSHACMKKRRRIRIPNENEQVAAKQRIVNFRGIAGAAKLRSDRLSLNEHEQTK